MLEQMRKNSRSLAIYIFTTVVIAVFIINFGPQSRGSSCDQAMGRNEHHAAEVAGETITTNDFRYGFLLSGGAQIPARYAKQERLKETVMDRLIDRQLLATEGERLGYVVTDEEVEDQIADARIVGLGAVHSVPRLQKDGKFNYDAFKTFVQLELGVTPADFIEQQKKEVLANRVRDFLREGVKVSDDEVKADFLRKNRQINLEYVRFSGRRYEGEVAPSEADVAAYAAKNEATLRKAYEDKKFVYEKAPAQRRLRQILVKVPKDAKPEVEKAAKSKLEGLAERIRKGSGKGTQATGKDAVTFADVARAGSEDAATKARGGDLGWRARGATGLGTDVEGKIWDAKPGTVEGPLRSTEGFVLVKVEATREGEISFENAKLDLAEEKLREERANARAKTAAEEAAAKAKQAPTVSLKTAFPSPSDSDETAADKPGAPPRVEETGLFAARGSREGIVIEGIGVSTAVAKAAFALTPAAPVAGPFEVNGNYVLIRLKERKDPDVAELDRRKLELVREAELAKGERVVGDWVHARCLEAKQDNRITVYPDVLRYEDSSEAPAYEPCGSHRGFGG